MDNRIALSLGGLLGGYSGQLYVYDGQGIALTRLDLTTRLTLMQFLDNNTIIGMSDGPDYLVYRINITTGVVDSLGFVGTSGKALGFPRFIDVDRVHGHGIALTATADQLVQFTATGASPVVETRPDTMTCVRYANGNTFLVGTATGKFYIMSYLDPANPTVITLPTGPYCGSLAPVHVVSDFVMLNTDTLLVATSSGAMFKYKLDGTYLASYHAAPGYNYIQSGLFLSNAVNGLFLQAGALVDLGDAIIPIFDGGTNPALDDPMQMDELYTTHNNLCNFYLDVTTKLMYAIFYTSGIIIAYEMAGLTGASVPTRAGDGSPIVDTAQSIIRICNPQDFRGRVEYNELVPAGVQNIPVRFDGLPYTEISYFGTPTKTDVRKFQ